MRSWRKRAAAALVALSLCPALALSEAEPEVTEAAGAAKAAVLIEQQTGHVLYACNAYAPLPMASTTKVMTCLLALEKGKLDDVVTAGPNAYGVPGTSIYLDKGEQMKLGDLLQGLMLASGNDAAVAIAEHIGGSVDEFCRMMTRRALELGCKNTVFLTPHGLPKDGHHTTAYDLALIAREAMRHQTFRAIVSTQRASIPWAARGYNRILNNKNRLLSEYEGATGIKTGFTKAAGRCLVFGARRDGLEVVGVVLSCPDWFEEAKRIMDAGFARYEMFTALLAGETVRLLPASDAHEDTVRILAETDLAAPVPRGRVPVLELDLPDALEGAQQQGEAIGLAALTLDGETLCTSRLVVGQAVVASDYGDMLDRLLLHWFSFHTISH